MPTFPRPNPVALDWSVRMNAETLAKIAAAKAKVRDALSEAQDLSVRLGESVWTREFTTDCLSDILSDLFSTIESRLTEEVEHDEHLLNGSVA